MMAAKSTACSLSDAEIGRLRDLTLTADDLAKIKDCLYNHIYKKKGKKWSESEEKLVVTWLHTGSRLKELLYIAAINLWYGATLKDTEDAVFDVALLFPKIKDSYDPDRKGAVRFDLFYKVCLKHHCWHKAKEHKFSESLDDEVPLNPIDEPLRGMDNPDMALLRECVARLDLGRSVRKHALVILLYYYRDCSYAQIEELTGINGVGVYLTNARHKLRSCFNWVAAQGGFLAATHTKHCNQIAHVRYLIEPIVAQTNEICALTIVMYYFVNKHTQDIATQLKTEPQIVKDCVDCDLAAIRHFLQNKGVEELAESLRRSVNSVQGCIAEATSAALVFAQPCLDETARAY